MGHATPLVYLSGPISFGPQTEMENAWRKTATSLLTDAGLDVLDPYRLVEYAMSGWGGFTIAVPKQFFEMCLNDMRRASAVMCNLEGLLPFQVDTLSTMELGWAFSLQKPVVVNVGHNAVLPLLLENMGRQASNIYDAIAIAGRLAW